MRIRNSFRFTYFCTYEKHFQQLRFGFWEQKAFFTSFGIISPLGSGSVDPHIFSYMDPWSQNVSDTIRIRIRNLSSAFQIYINQVKNFKIYASKFKIDQRWFYYLVFVQNFRICCTFILFLGQSYYSVEFMQIWILFLCQTYF